MSRSSIILRRAVPTDIEAIEELVTAAFSQYVDRIGRKPEPMLTDYRTAPMEHQLWVLASDYGLIAILELVSHATYLLIKTLAVTPLRQGTGLGRRLMTFAEAEAKRQGHSELRLYTNERLTENLRFYANLGYAARHREPVGGGTNLVHMVKFL